MGPVHTGSESLGYGIGRQGTMTRYLEGSLNYNAYLVTIAWELFSFIIRKSIPTPRLPTQCSITL
mgnify:FL=1